MSITVGGDTYVTIQQNKIVTLDTVVRVILKYSFEVYNNYLRIFYACFHIVCILYIVDNLVSNGIAED